MFHMQFLNRKLELTYLKKIGESQGAAFVVIYGRRRIGKTRLLLEWLNQSQGLYWVADESSANLQRRYFSLALEQHLSGFSQIEYPDWSIFFERLAKEANQANWRGPLVIDEFPYLVATSPELPSILQRFIDHEAKKAKLIVAICGSDQRLIQGLILNANEPLYGRAQAIIKLEPLHPYYLQFALKLKTAKECVKTYSIWGGIPRYWELAAALEGSLNESIESLVLNPQGILHEEPMRLLLEELPPAITLRPILDAIGFGMHKLSEIAGRLNVPSTSLSRPLERLRDLGYVEKEIPFGALEKNSKRTLYKIKDPFLRFWFDVVAPRRSALSQTTKKNRILWLEKSFPFVIAQTWEELCRQAIPYLSDIWGGIPFEPARRFWHGAGPEWDIVAESFDKKILLLGEVKWKDEIPSVKFLEKTAQELISKGSPSFHSNFANIYYVIFVPEKPKNKKILSNNIFFVDASDVIILAGKAALEN